jgi:ABC-type protease/lipase transport system fused ATPase/permease subunit
LVTVQKQGYQTIVSAGNALSGGTRQRIGLARAFYGNPKLLILDEPNANLDADGEAALEKALVQAKEAGTTIVIITHRPAIVLRCDKAMVLRDGALETFGPASEVLQRLSGNSARSGATETKVRKGDAFSRQNPQPISAEKLSLVQNDVD